MIYVMKKMGHEYFFIKRFTKIMQKMGNILRTFIHSQYISFSTTKPACSQVMVLSHII